ncbi:MAG: hypothetical protein EP329_13310 [Deltaproteobacteria bacterium]|nr:MAG: hypothetical protein EP329_13310 [Deltaproteobacteria bacterium]
MRATLLAAIGAVFTGLLLVLPASWGARWLGLPVDGLGWTLIALPYLVLPFAVRGTRPWVTLWAWPASHLPALVSLRGVTDRAVHEGSGGLWALLAVAVAGTAWFLVYLWPPRPVPDAAPPADAPDFPAAGRVHPLSAATLVVVVAITAAFYRAAFGERDVEPLAANVTLLVGAVAAWYAGVRAIGVKLAEVVLDPHARRRYRASLVLQRRPTRGSLLLALGLAAAAVLVVLAWYLVDLR